MAWPLRILAICAVGIGLAVGPTHQFAGYIQHAVGLVHVEAHLHYDLMVASAVMAAVGIGIAWFFYRQSPGIPAGLAAGLKPLYLASWNKLYFDEIFTAILVRPLAGLARLSAYLDKQLIDRLVDAVGEIPRTVSTLPSKLHAGVTSSYALVMWAGVIVYLGLLMFS